jgi:hypothetical protein
MTDGRARDTGNSPTRVTRTGLAVVHEGEVVVPALGDEAMGLAEAWNESMSVAYHFPVEIEVRAAPSLTEVQALIDAALESLAARLSGR